MGSCAAFVVVVVVVVVVAVLAAIVEAIAERHWRAGEDSGCPERSSEKRRGGKALLGQ